MALSGSYDRLRYGRDYAAAIRRTRKPGHEGCDLQSCCADGLRNYRRVAMQKARDRARATRKAGHELCQKETCCADGLRNAFRRWKKKPPAIIVGWPAGVSAVWC